MWSNRVIAIALLFSPMPAALKPGELLRISRPAVESVPVAPDYYRCGSCKSWQYLDPFHQENTWKEHKFVSGYNEMEQRATSAENLFARSPEQLTVGGPFDAESNPFLNTDPEDDDWYHELGNPVNRECLEGEGCHGYYDYFDCFEMHDACLIGNFDAERVHADLANGSEEAIGTKFRVLMERVTVSSTGSFVTLRNCKGVIVAQVPMNPKLRNVVARINSHRLTKLS